MLLAVLVLSAAAPGAAARDQPKEAGPTGRATADYTVWADVPNEALTIFDTRHPGGGSVEGELVPTPAADRVALRLILYQTNHWSRHRTGEGAGATCMLMAGT